MNDKRQMNDFLMNVKPLLGAVARFENLGGHIVLGGNNVPPLVEIGLTDLSKTGEAKGMDVVHKDHMGLLCSQCHTGIPND